MDISTYVDTLRTDLLAAASAGGPELAATAERLSGSLDAAVRLALLEALSDAAAEITSELGDRTVEVRLRGRDPHFAVDGTTDTTAPNAPTEIDAPADEDDDGSTARITLRLGESLKQRAEESAARARQSLNSWLVDAIRAAVHDGHGHDGPGRGGGRGRRRPGQQLSGWAR